jgi:hypothetical protein
MFPSASKKQLKVSERAGLRGIAPFGVRTFLPALLEIAQLESHLSFSSLADSQHPATSRKAGRFSALPKPL